MWKQEATNKPPRMTTINTMTHLLAKLAVLLGVLSGCGIVLVAHAEEQATCAADGSCRSDEDLLHTEIERCQGTIIDPHLHTAPWFDNGETLSNALAEAKIGIGLLYNPYPNIPLPYDINEYVTSIAESSQGHVYALASLNTTHENWDMFRDSERKRLATFLKHDLVLGTKLAPPHTCLKLQGQKMDDIVEVVSEAKKKVLAIHIGTTPFCGPLGKQFNITTCCDRDYVDPRLLVPYIERFPEITFVLLHSGHEFLHHLQRLFSFVTSLFSNGAYRATTLCCCLQKINRLFSFKICTNPHQLGRMALP